MSYRLLDRDKVWVWVEGLRKGKGSAKQRELLQEAAKDDRHSFADYVEDQIKGGDGGSAYIGDGETPSLKKDDGTSAVNLTAGHMYLMPHEDIVSLYQHWEGIPLEVASDPRLWGAITLSEIRDGRIKPTWLAADRGKGEDAAKADICAGAEKGNPKHTDYMVRRVLRLMMGPGNFRGAPELYANCSLAKAWWCGLIASQCAQSNPGANSPGFGPEAEALKLVWLELADYLPARLKVVGEQSILHGLILWARKAIDKLETDDPDPITRKKVRAAIHRLGEISSWCVIGIRDPEEISGEVVLTIESLQS